MGDGRIELILESEEIREAMDNRPERSGHAKEGVDAAKRRRCTSRVERREGRHVASSRGTGEGGCPKREGRNYIVEAECLYWSIPVTWKTRKKGKPGITYSFEENASWVARGFIVAHNGQGAFEMTVNNI